ncbi:MAG: metalloregulator ArsR/SmtB family transcription factor [Candidatus Limnocylindrales bacterium]
MVKQSAASLDVIFGALADPTRRAIVRRLAAGEASVSELAAPFTISLPAISKHLVVLRRAGLLNDRKEGRIRRCWLRADSLAEADRWLADYRAFWETRFEALATHLARESR